ncbi:MAG: AAA family ATPase [Solobacterium sp.]|nr:AAA family ATPase [Solobacterium sp.]
MHIEKAKEQIRNAVLAYNAKDTYGRYRIPVSKQRPIFLIGAPGIGKTAIVEQIAEELGIGFVSYAMTHHTRQSALGLPYIVNKKYGDAEYSVSEYTMSEILASVYEEMKRTGKTEGILFLDEINCVSETLAPGILQFLQYKTFGRHRVPDGWVIVTAGNPSEFNENAREFDIAMLDRLKKITVEPDLDVWKTYAADSHVHPVILAYLQLRPQHFYHVETTLDGMSFVTARSWDDLSQMLTIYEDNNLPADKDLIAQYLQDEDIARSFANYYDLYRKYHAEYPIEDILQGTVSDEVIQRAHQASFDERLSLVTMIVSALDDRITKQNVKETVLRRAIPLLRAQESSLHDFLQNSIDALQDAHTDQQLEEKALYEQLLNTGDSWQDIRPFLQKEASASEADAAALAESIEHVFAFFENSFGNGQEILILVSELTVRKAPARFLLAHESASYARYQKQLLFHDTKSELHKKIDALQLPGTD